MAKSRSLRSRKAHLYITIHNNPEKNQKVQSPKVLIQILRNPKSPNPNKSISNPKKTEAAN